MRRISSLVAPIVDHAFFEKAQFERLFRDHFLQITGFAAQVFDFIGCGSTGCVTGQTPLPSE